MWMGGITVVTTGPSLKTLEADFRRTLVRLVSEKFQLTLSTGSMQRLDWRLEQIRILPFCGASRPALRICLPYVPRVDWSGSVSSPSIAATVVSFHSDGPQDDDDVVLLFLELHGLWHAWTNSEAKARFVEGQAYLKVETRWQQIYWTESTCTLLMWANVMQKQPQLIL